MHIKIEIPEERVIRLPTVNYPEDSPIVELPVLEEMPTTIVRTIILPLESIQIEIRNERYKVLRRVDDGNGDWENEYFSPLVERYYIHYDLGGIKERNEFGAVEYERLTGLWAKLNILESKEVNKMDDTLNGFGGEERIKSGEINALTGLEI